MEFFALLSTERLVSSLAMTLIHFTWQAALIALVLKLILSFSKKQSLKLRYYAAVLALSTCVIWPSYTFNAIYHEVQKNPSVQDSAPPDTVLSILTFNQSFDQLTPRQNQILSRTPTQLPFDYQLLVLLWVLGVSLMTVKFIYDLRQTYRLTRVGVAPVDEEISLMVKQISKRFDIQRRVKILKSNLVNVPVVIGWFKPTVLLPIAIFIGLDRQQLELILAHELAHVKRLDFLVNLMQGLMQVLFFYHPCIYWMNKVLREEREYICDSMALSAFQNAPAARLELAKALLNIEELKEGNLQLVAVAASDGHLKSRISRIVLNEKLRIPSARGVLIVIIGMIFSVTTIAVTADMSANFTQPSSMEAVNTIQQSMVDDSIAGGAIASRFKNNRRNEATLAGHDEPVLDSRIGRENEVKVEPAYFANERLNTSRSINETNSRKETRDSESFAVKQISPPADFEQAALKVSTPIKRDKAPSKERVTESPDTANNLRVKNRNAVEDKAIPAVNKSIVTAQAEKLPDLASQNEQKLREVSTTRIALLDAKVKPQFIAPKALETPYPVYPSGAYRNNLKGRVKVDFVIDESGQVVNPQFNEGTPWIFLREIKSKLKRWRYEPASKNGENIAYSSSVYFDFELPEDEPLSQYQVGSRIKRKLR